MNPLNPTPGQSQAQAGAAAGAERSPQSDASTDPEEEGASAGNSSVMVCDAMIDELEAAKMRRIILTPEEEKLLKIILDVLDLKREIIPEDSYLRDIFTFLRWLVYTKLKLTFHRKREEFLRNLFKVFSYFRKYHLDTDSAKCVKCGDYADVVSACPHAVHLCSHCARTGQVISCENEACTWDSTQLVQFLRRQ